MHPLQGSTPSLTTSSTHTQNKRRMDLSWDHCSSSLQAKHTFDQKISNLPLLSFIKFDTPQVKTTKTESSFRKFNSSPTKLGMLFPAHLPDLLIIHELKSAQFVIQSCPTFKNHLFVTICIVTRALHSNHYRQQHCCPSLALYYGDN